MPFPARTVSAQMMALRRFAGQQPMRMASTGLRLAPRSQRRRKQVAALRSGFKRPG